MLKLRDERQVLQALRDEVNVRAYRNVDVIGLTTSGAAKHLALLSALGAGVLLCEEAAEVLEPHLLASISRDTKHVILIGDHLQLRPKVERYELQCDSGKQHRLDLSLFERLVSDQNLRASTLSTQWRMRPDIADIPRTTLYPLLQDAEKVKCYPNVRGVRRNLWFVDHTRTQDGADSGSEMAHTHTHTWEAEMVVVI